MEPSTQGALIFMEEIGFTVEVIPTAGSPRADIRARHGMEEYVIEAKSRDVSLKWTEFEANASAEGLATMSRQLIPWNAISSMLMRAGKQLKQTPSSGEAFLLIWIFAAHPDEKFVLDCVAKRICGLAKLVVVDPCKPDISIKPCFYYTDNDFRRLEHVHGAVLCCSRGLRLYANSFCHTRARFRESRLYRVFAKGHAICDPEILENDGSAFVLGVDFDSSGAKNAAWTYLKRKYGARTSPMIEEQFNGLIVVPRDTLKGTG